MTTAAWDGETLAADTMGTSGGFRISTPKARRLKDGRLFCGSGDAQDSEAVRIWLESGGEKPSVKDWVGILIGADASIWRMEEKLFQFQILDRFHAIGSGRDYAIAAMAMGKNARQAVELAAQFDVWTGGAITELRLGEPA